MTELLSRIQNLSRAARIATLEKRAEEVRKIGDFEGSVSGKWKGLDTSGGGLVEYEGKLYVTKRQGFTSLFKDSSVQLTYVDGIYYSSW